MHITIQDSDFNSFLTKSSAGEDEKKELMEGNEEIYSALQM